MERGDHVLSSPPPRMAATATSDYALSWGILKWPSLGDFGWPPGAVFVLHCFQKKSKRGIATPREDMVIIRARLKVAEALAKEFRNEKASH